MYFYSYLAKFLEHMKIGLVTFPGSNCDNDLRLAIKRITGKEPIALWHKDTDLQGCRGVFLPGGFSYGDYLRSGAIARFSPIMQEIIKFAQNGGLVMGICNGFQILTEAGLLPGTLLKNDNQLFNCSSVFIKPATQHSIITQNLTQNPLKIPIAHGEGRYFCPQDTLNDLQEYEQILFRYCNESGEVSPASNPNGSLESIAGVCNKNKNVFGMMPHPERAADSDIHNTDGLEILRSFCLNS